MKISINNQVIEMMDIVGGNTLVIDDQIKINGKTIDNIDIGTNGKITVEVIKGTLHHVKSAGSVNCNNVSGSVSANGSVNCNDVMGNVSANGSVNCNDISGSAHAGGSINQQ